MSRISGMQLGIVDVKAMAIIVLLTLAPLPAFSAEYVVKNGTDLNTRSGPGKNFKKQGKIKGGTDLFEIERNGVWSKVRLTGGKIVWVHNGFIRKVEKARKVQNIEKVDKVKEDVTSRATVLVKSNTGHASTTYIRDVSVNGAESLFLSVDNNGLGILRSLATQQILKVLRLKKEKIISGNLHFKKDIAVTGTDNGSLHIWDLKSARITTSLKLKKFLSDNIISTEHILKSYFIDNGSTVLAITQNGTVVMWDWSDNILIDKFQMGLATATRNPFVYIDNTRKIFSVRSPGNLDVWDIDTKRKVKAITIPSTTYVELNVVEGNKEIVLSSRQGELYSINYQTYQEEKITPLLKQQKGIKGIVTISYNEKDYLCFSTTQELNCPGLASTTGVFYGGRQFIGYSKVHNIFYNAGFGPIDFYAFPNLEQLDPVVSQVSQSVLATFSSSGNDIFIASSAVGATTIVEQVSLSQRLRFRQYGPSYDNFKSIIGKTVGGKNQLIGLSRDGETHIWESIDDLNRKKKNALKIPRATQVYPESEYTKNSLLSLSKDGSLGAIWGRIGSKFVSVMNMKDGKLLGKIKHSHHNGPEFVQIHSDSKRITIVYYDKYETWDINKWEKIAEEKLPVKSAAVAFRENTNSLVHARTNIVSDSKGLRHRISISNTPLDGSGSKTIYESILSKSYFDKIVLNSDGNLAALSDFSGEIAIFDFNHLQHQILTGHTGNLTGLQFSPDNRLLLSSSNDGTVRLWRVSDGKELVQFIFLKDGSWMQITPEGFFDYSKNATSISIVDGVNILPIERFHDTLYRPDLVLEALRGDPDGRVKESAANLNLGKIWATGLPPLIRNFTSLEGRQVRADKINLTAEIINSGGGIGRVEIKVNGATQIVDTQSSSENSLVPVKVSQSVFLTPGKNQIEIVSYNSSNLITSAVQQITVQSTAETKNKVSLYILAIGVDKYQDKHIQQLKYAVADAISIGDAFSTIAKDTFENVHLTTILDEDATVEKLNKIFDHLKLQVQPQDVFVFFLAGHGKTHDGRYYFIPANFKLDGAESLITDAIGQLQWQKWMAQVPAQKSVFLYDTCESGSLIKDKLNDGLEFATAFNRLTRATGRTILTASTDTEPALEGYRGHGVFSYIVLDALGSADIDKDGQMEVTELASHIKTELPVVSFEAFKHRQIPRSSITGYSFSLGTPTNVVGR